MLIGKFDAIRNHVRG